MQFEDWVVLLTDETQASGLIRTIRSSLFEVSPECKCKVGVLLASCSKLESEQEVRHSAYSLDVITVYSKW